METTVENLSDDILLEILARVTDVAALFRCAMTCNRWRQLVADPSFLRRRWPDKAPTLIGFFAMRRHDRDGILERGIIAVPPATMPAFVPVPQSPFGRGDLFSLIPQAAGLLDSPVVVASRHGLLLVQFYPHGPPVDRHVRLAVCSLLAGTCDVLPPLKSSTIYGLDFNGYAILSGADFCSSSDNLRRRTPLPGYSTLFKVVVIANRTWNTQHYFYTFSSDQAKWRAHSTLGCDEIANPTLFMYDRTAVVRRDTAHWLFRDQSSMLLLHVNTMTDHIFMEKLMISPVKNFIRLNVDAEGMLGLYYFRNEDLSLQIWRRQDQRVQTGDGTTEYWLHIQAIQLKLPGQRQNMSKPNHWMSLGENSGMYLLLTRNRRAYITHVQTGVMESVTSWFSGLNCDSAVRVEIDWPELFMSSLQQR